MDSIRNKYLSPGMKIEMGSGEYPRYIKMGFYHSDVRYPLPHQDLVFSIKQLPFKDNSIDCIAIMHMLEHISWLEIQGVFDDLFRILKSSGELLIVVPNILYGLVELDKEKSKKQFEDDLAGIMGDLYGLQDYTANTHLMGFTPEYMRYLLENSGFTTVVIPRERYNSNVEAWAYK